MKFQAGRIIFMMLWWINMHPCSSAEPDAASPGDGCLSGYAASDPGGHPHLSGVQCLSAQEGSMMVKQGDVFSVNLPANPSTGASWGLTALPETLMLTDIYHQAGQCGGRTGCGGMTTYVFRAIKKGSAVIKLQYGRAWEKKAWENRRLKITVK